MVTLSYTYEIVTPESAADGCAAEHGWWMPGGTEWALEDDDGRHENVLDEAKAGAFDHTLRATDALRDIASTLGACEYELNGDTLRASEIDGEQDWCSGAETRRTAHIKGAPRLLRAMLRAMTVDLRVGS